MVSQKQITKVCLRHLPPDMTSEELLEMIAPDLPPYDHYQFHPGDKSLAPLNMTRAYFNFPIFDHVIEMQHKFDGQIFESKTGAEYTCLVEAAPYQSVPKVREKEDKYHNTINEDDHFKAFLEQYNAETAPVEQINIDKYLVEAAQKEEDRKKPMSTPLIEFIRAKKDKKKAARNERRKQENERRQERNAERKKAKAAERKEKQNRKKELIDSKTKEKKETDDKKDEKKEGGRMAARERRKKEAEERRKAKVAEKKKERDGGNTENSQSKEPRESSAREPREPKGEKRNNNKGKRYSKRNDSNKGGPKQPRHRVF